MASENTGKTDYSYWLKVRVWSANEAAALLLGFEPRYANYRFSSSWFNDDDKSEDVDRTAISVERQNLEYILESALLAGEFGKVKLNKIGEPVGKTVTWQKWLTWAKRNDIDCAEELLSAISEYDEQRDFGTGDPHPRTETSLLRIIGALLHELKESTGQSQASIIDKLVDLHGHKGGISESNLENYFADANRRLEDW